MATLLNGSTFNGVPVGAWGCCSVTNTVVGYETGHGMYNTSADNTIVGFQAANQIGGLYGNTAMGAYTLRGFKGAGPGPGCLHFNVAIGVNSMCNVDAGSCKNVAVGYRTLSNGTPVHTVAIGHLSVSNGVMGGNCNTFVGIATANQNTVGGSCNVGIGSYALNQLNNGNSNIGIGFGALGGVTNGNNNIAIGLNANYAIVNVDNTIAIGYVSQTSNTSNHTAAGSSIFTCFRVGAPAWTTLSDRRDKTDILPLNENLGLNFIRNLRPVKFNFDFRDNYVRQCGFEYGIKDGTLKQDFDSYGFIAQEIENNLKNIQEDFDALNKNENGDYRLDYEDLISPIIKSLQQTIERLEILESKV